MSLDLTRVAAQVGAMIGTLKNTGAERRERLAFALATLNDPAIDAGDLKKKIEAAKTTWLVAGLTEGLNQRYPAPAVPKDFTVMATDGSHIDVDRHRAARCYLINTGSVSLTYGSQPDAQLSSTPTLYADPKDMVITQPGGGREYLMDSNLLGIRRSVEEWRALTEMARQQPPGSTTLALIDGTLIQWGLEGYPDYVADVLLVKGFLECLDVMKKLGADRTLVPASYISFPGGTDVVNALRVAVCPNDIPDCDRDCPAGAERACERVAGLRDRDIFFDLLAPGERSGLFVSPSKITERYGEHRVYFFYVKAGEEIARIEVPQWVAQDKRLVGLAHGLALDQCRKGHGYPVVLSEAHEQAVVTGADREYFWELVESVMADEKISTTGSAKSLSKRTRWI